MRIVLGMDFDTTEEDVALSLSLIEELVSNGATAGKTISGVKWYVCEDDDF